VLKKNVDNSNFLWVTRGEKWGFRYLSKCSLLTSHIDFIYKKLFLSDESRLGYWKGNIVINKESKYQYVACRCYDDTCIQKDEAGRRIPHEFLLLCSVDDCNMLANLPWGALIIDKIRNQYLELLHCSSNEVGDCLIDFSLEASLESGEREFCDSSSLDLFVSSTPAKPNHSNQKFVIYVLWGIILVFLIFCLAYYHHSLRHPPEECQRIIDNRENGEIR